MNALVPLPEVWADERLEVYLAYGDIPVVKKRFKSADMAGMKMGYRNEVEVYFPARSFLEVARRVVCVLCVAAVNEGESVAALEKNTVCAPGVEKMDALALRRNGDILVMRRGRRIFGGFDDLRRRRLEFILLL